LVGELQRVHALAVIRASGGRDRRHERENPEHAPHDERIIEPITPHPSKIGRHQVVGYIATGGMAELFLGKEDSGRPIVIKRILPHLSRQSTFVSMFIDEARIGSVAKHPNLVEVFELGQVGSDLFLVMEYLVGENLAGLVRRLVKRGERLQPALAAFLIAEVCDGLHAAHELSDERGERLELVHRDVSPQNIFITYGGDVKLLDFGVATAASRLTQTATGEVKGKYAYMSPEQCRGEALDRRSDIFSLGTVLYELTTLRRLFKRGNELKVMKAVCEEPIPRPTREVQDYPAVLEAICARALAHDREQRYASAAEMRADLLAAMTELAIDGDPHAALAATLARVFADRVVQKQQLVDRVNAGGPLDELLVAEVDEQVDVPVVSQHTATALSALRPKTPAERSATRKMRRLRALAVPIAVAAIAGAAVGGWLRMHRASAPALAADATPHVESVAPVTPVDPHVTLHVETVPSGATVLVDGRARGETPLDVPLDRGPTPVHVEVRATGFQSAAQDAAPDRDRGLDFTLTRAPIHAAPAKKPASKPGFHRFD
jgi:serine/threonine-protein kinase